MTGSYKTTLIGAATAFFGFVLFSPEHFTQWPWLLDLSKYAFLGGLASLGVASKDFNVSGGSK
jgi:hypothetical protein